MTYEIKKFINEISSSKPYTLLFLKFYKNPSILLIDGDFDSENYKTHPYYLILTMNNDFTKLIKLCFFDEEFKKKLTLDICKAITCILHDSIDFKKSFLSINSDYIFDQEYSEEMNVNEIMSNASNEIKLKEHKLLFQKFSEEKVNLYEEKETALILELYYQYIKDLYKNAELERKKKEFLGRIENDDYESGDTILSNIILEGNTVLLSREMKSILICSNEFLRIINRLLDQDKITDITILKKIKIIISCGIDIKKLIAIDLNYYYKLLNKEVIKNFNIELANWTIHRIAEKLEENTKQAFVLLKGQK